MANGYYASPTQDQEYQNFMDWFNRLSNAAKAGMDYWPWESIPYQNYKTQRAYKRYKELSPAGMAPGVAEKAAKYVEQQRQKAEAAAAPEAAPAAETAYPGMVTRWETEVRNGYVWRVGYDANGNMVDLEAVGRAAETGMSEAERAAQALEQQRLQWEQQRFQAEEAINPYEQAMLDFQRQQLQQQQQQFQLQQQLQREQMQAESQYQQQMFNWYREQAQMEAEAEKQRQLANLRANPASWLEYASLAGETPAVQPWMVPLSPQDYNMQVGQPLPGWSAQAESLETLPQLKTPSAQYLARIAPSSREQYAGYEQARTGGTAEDIGWLLGSKVAPPGGSSGLRWVR